jgi:hypothetical protein
VEARTILAKAIDADPTLANSYNELGLSYLDGREWGAAAAQFAAAVLPSTPDVSQGWPPARDGTRTGRALRSARVALGMVHRRGSWNVVAERCVD